MTEEYSFRPQQGLLIMNNVTWQTFYNSIFSFRPQQGLLIMNRSTYQRQWFNANYVSVPNRGYLLWIERTLTIAYLFYRFRPQQGLLIMNI